MKGGPLSSTLIRNQLRHTAEPQMWLLENSLCSPVLPTSYSVSYVSFPLGTSHTHPSGPAALSAGPRKRVNWPNQSASPGWLQGGLLLVPPPEMEQLTWLTPHTPPHGPLTTRSLPQKTAVLDLLSLLPSQPLATLFLREIRGDYLGLL